jgi:hypothetical protein
MTHDAARYLPASDGDSVALAVNGCRALAASGQVQQPPLGWRANSKTSFDQTVFQIAGLPWSVR